MNQLKGSQGTGHYILVVSQTEQNCKEAEYSNPRQHEVKPLTIGLTLVGLSG